MKFQLNISLLENGYFFAVVNFCWMFMGFISASVHFIARPNTYVENALSKFGGLSSMECCAECASDENCLAVSYKATNSECEILAEHPNRYLDKILSEQDWVLYTKEDGCGGDWLPLNQRCYLLNETETSWYDADTHCKSLNSELVDIHSPKENAFVFNYSNTNAIKPIWIGLYSPANVRDFNWTSGRPLTYTAYGPNEPDAHPGRHCSVCNSEIDNMWDDRWTTGFLFAFVCEKEGFH